MLSNIVSENETLDYHTVRGIGVNSVKLCSYGKKTFTLSKYHNCTTLTVVEKRIQLVPSIIILKQDIRHMFENQNTPDKNKNKKKQTQKQTSKKKKKKTQNKQKQTNVDIQSKYFSVYSLFNIHV